MTPLDFRNATFEQIRERLLGDRLAVYHALLSAPRPLTTRELAAAMGRDPFSVRPRVTELCQLGMAEPAGAGGRRGREGRYAAVPIAAWQERRRRERLETERQARQLELRIGA